MTIVVYVLRSVVTGRRYVGLTNNLLRRLEEHRRGTALSSRILGPFEVLLTEEHAGYGEARQRERFLKSGQGREWLDRVFGVRVGAGACPPQAGSNSP
jgi:putative endonuclease